MTLGIKHYIAIALLLALVGYLGWSWMEIRALNAENESLGVQLAGETQRADQNAAALDRYAEATEHNNALAAEVRAQRASLRDMTRQLQERIASAPSSDDAPIAPVLLDALDGLRRIYDAAHGDPLRDDGSAAGTPEVRERHASAGRHDDAKSTGCVAYARSCERVVMPTRSRSSRRGSMIFELPNEPVYALRQQEQTRIYHRSSNQDAQRYDKTTHARSSKSTG